MQHRVGQGVDREPEPAEIAGFVSNVHGALLTAASAVTAVQYIPEVMTYYPVSGAIHNIRDY